MAAFKGLSASIKLADCSMAKYICCWRLIWPEQIISQVPYRGARRNNRKTHVDSLCQMIREKHNKLLQDLLLKCTKTTERSWKTQTRNLGFSHS